MMRTTESNLSIDEAIQYFVDMYQLAMHGIRNKNEVQQRIKEAQRAQDDFTKREALKGLVNVELETDKPDSASQRINTALTGA